MTISPEIISLIALGLALVSFVITVLIYLRVRKFFRTGSGQSFEDAAHSILADLSNLKNFQIEMLKYVEVLEKRLGRSLQVALSKRYNPFKGIGEGGLLSHSTALLSEKGDGVVLSTLSTRDRVSVFAKPVKQFNPLDVELTPEEKEVMEEAKKSVLL